MKLPSPPPDSCGRQPHGCVCWKRTALWSTMVFTVAVTLRMPSCYESLWVDELHSAWTVWGNLGDVMPRADRGHQSPFYFVGLWFWKQAIGESELALRMSSVLAVAAACAILTFGIARWAGSVLAGVASGMVLAIESNSLFFGTELRPFSWVIFFSSLALLAYLPLIGSNGRQQHRRSWTFLIVMILLAALSQPTAIGVLAWLPFTLAIAWLVRDHRQFFRLSLLDTLLALMTAAVGFALWRITLGESWNERSNWTSFASAKRWQEIWAQWDWTSLWIFPVAMVAISLVISRFRRQSASKPVSPTLWLAAITIVATASFWIVSRLEWIPVWQRRYFIAVLPALACVAGGSVAALVHALRPGKFQLVVGAVAAAGLVVGLAYRQHTLQRLPDYPVALVHRGEDWRGAIEWLNSRVESRDIVYLDSGLIETRQLVGGTVSVIVHAPEPDQVEYLSYPVLGPYSLQRGRIELISRVQWFGRPGDRQRGFILTRRPLGSIRQNSLPIGSSATGFGNLSIIVIPSKVDLLL